VPLTLADLGTEERAALVAVLLAGGDAAALARLGGTMAARCAEVARGLAALERSVRAQALAQAAVALGAGVPANLALVHPSWIEAALEGEGDAVRRAVAGDANEAADASMVTWLRRRALGAFVDMPASLPAAELLQERLEALGRSRLALALQAAPVAAQAQVAARLGGAHAAALLAALRTPGSRAKVSAAVRELHDLVAGSAPMLLVRAGARHLAPALAAQGDRARVLAQRLPRAAGLVLLDEVARAQPDAARAAALAALLA